MKAHLNSLLLVIFVVLLAIAGRVDLARAAPPGQVEGVGEGQILTRGPVHEAFAETVSFDAQPGLVAPKSPPASIEELPPDQKPEGENIAWIPGYWAWDDDRSDFLWVSGIWRSLPPGRQWTPGYWAASGKQAQWTSGYWADAKANETEYLPEPPRTVDAGPNIAAPSPDHIWHSGSWIWQQTRYAWRPGYWATAQPDWVWTPAHYLWSPRGYVFVDGFWDYSVARRGTLFAPVYFNPGVYARRGFVYSPATVINPAVFANYLFLRPNYGHYYFGDYYATNYRGAGFYPSFAVQTGGYGYDPIFTHQRWEQRQNRGWEQRMAAEFQHRRDNESARPPRTLDAMNQLVARGGQPAGASSVLATPLEQLARSNDRQRRFQPVNSIERQRLVQNGLDAQRFREQRMTLERQAVKSPASGQPVTVKRPVSPIVARPNTGLGKSPVPPNIHEVPGLDPNVAPMPRQGASGVNPIVARPKSERPRIQPNPTTSPRPVRTNRQPAPEQPKPQPKSEPPKAQSKPAPTKVQPKPEQQKTAPPKIQPQPEGLKAQPKPLKTQKKPEPPKAQPK